MQLCAYEFSNNNIFNFYVYDFEVQSVVQSSGIWAYIVTDVRVLLWNFRDQNYK